MDTFLYFAYGSNMSTPRLHERVISAIPVFMGKLIKHQLKFHKKSKDGSGKCDIEFTNNDNDIVYGVVYRVNVSDKIVLDNFEGLGNGYDEKQVSIQDSVGTFVVATTYFAKNIDPSLSPYSWYKEHVLRGAHEHGLPMAYIDKIDGFLAIQDNDIERHSKELSIYTRNNVMSNY